MKRTASPGKATSQRPADMGAYIAAAAPDKRAALRKLRKDIQAAAPRAEEGLSYGMPAFRLDGRVEVPVEHERSTGPAAPDDRGDVRPPCDDVL